MAFEKACGPCSGLGYYGVDPGATCKVCRGTGEVTLWGQQDDYKSCGLCLGRGYYGVDRLDTCAVCKGFGVIVRPLRAPTMSGRADG
jgi:DnaJ-class molecular chaperone